MAVAVPAAAPDRSSGPAAAGAAARSVVRLGVVRYLNTLPLIRGLGALRGFELVPDVPSRLIDRLAGGEVDLALCSVVDAVRSPVPVRIVPVGMLGCDGPTLTVRLYSRRPWGEVRTVAADADSHTSRALAEVILRRRMGASPAFAEFDRASGARDPGTDAMLLIGDKVVTDPPAPDAWPFVLDLGEEWHAWTGLPFVFATWLARTDADPRAAARLRTAARVLDHQRRHNRERLDAIAVQEAGRHGWPEELARTYLGELLRFDLDARAREGLGRFLAECRSLGLVPPAEPLVDDAW